MFIHFFSDNHGSLDGWPEKYCFLRKQNLPVRMMTSPSMTGRACACYHALLSAGRMQWPVDWYLGRSGGDGIKDGSVKQAIRE